MGLEMSYMGWGWSVLWCGCDECGCDGCDECGCDGCDECGCDDYMCGEGACACDECGCDRCFVVEQSQHKLLAHHLKERERERG